MEFLVHILIAPPDGTAPQEITARVAEEGERAAQLASQGIIRRLWRPADGKGLWRNIGLWSADSEPELRAAIASLPLHPWMTVEITALADHPNDPSRAGGEKAPTGAPAQ